MHSPAARPRPRPWLTFPNLLCLLRLALAPVALLLLLNGQPRATFWTLAVAFGTDLVDGPLARRLGQVTPLGASLDSAADLALSAAVLLGGLRLYLSLLSQFTLLLAVGLVLGVAAHVVSLVRFRRQAGFHTWLAKATGALAAVAVLDLLWAGRATWLVSLAFLVGVLTQLEQLAVALTLREWQPDVRSILHVKGPRH